MALGIGWPIALLTTTPPSLTASLGWVVYLIAITTLLGGAISIVGLIMSAQTGAKAVIGLTVELVGLGLLLVGPFADALTSLLISFIGFGQYPGTRFIASAFFAYAMFAAILNRILIVAPRRRKEAHDPSKLQ